MPELSRHYPDGPPVGVPLDLDRWFRALGNVRHRGYGINDGLSERGLTAIGATVHGRDGRPVAALCVSAPCMRLSRPRIPAVATALRKVVAEVESAGVL
jgi:DNA-binding IclR family transcriptional regulator